MDKPSFIGTVWPQGRIEVNGYESCVVVMFGGYPASIDIHATTADELIDLFERALVELRQLPHGIDRDNAEAWRILDAAQRVGVRNVDALRTAAVATGGEEALT